MIVSKGNGSNADLIAYDYGLIVTAGSIQKTIMNAQSKHLIISFVPLLSDQCDSCISKRKREIGCSLGSIPKTHPNLFHTIPIGT